MFLTAKGWNGQKRLETVGLVPISSKTYFAITFDYFIVITIFIFLTNFLALQKHRKLFAIAIRKFNFTKFIVQMPLVIGKYHQLKSFSSDQTRRKDAPNNI